MSQTLPAPAAKSNVSARLRTKTGTPRGAPCPAADRRRSALRRSRDTGPAVARFAPPAGRGPRRASQHPLPLQQAALPRQSAGETAQAAVAREYAVTRHQHRDRVGAAGRPHGPRSVRSPHTPRYVPVTPRLPWWNALQLGPHGPLKGRAARQVHRRERPGGPTGQRGAQRSRRLPVPLPNSGRHVPRHPVTPCSRKRQTGQTAGRIARQEGPVGRRNRQPCQGRRLHFDGPIGECTPERQTRPRSCRARVF